MYVLSQYSTTCNLRLSIHSVVGSWGSEETPSATQFFKRAYKISQFPRLLVSLVDLPCFATSSKIWPNFINKVVEKLISSKNANNKKCASKFVFFNEKKNEKESDDFWHRKLTLKVHFSHIADKLAKLGKASQDAYNPGKWLIL